MATLHAEHAITVLIECELKDGPRTAHFVWPVSEYSDNSNHYSIAIGETASLQMHAVIPVRPLTLTIGEAMLKPAERRKLNSYIGKELVDKVFAIDLPMPAILPAILSYENRRAIATLQINCASTPEDLRGSCSLMLGAQDMLDNPLP